MNQQECILLEEYGVVDVPEMRRGGVFAGVAWKIDENKEINTNIPAFT
jgi:hypothetical protein